MLSWIQSTFSPFASFIPSNHLGTIYVVKEAIVSLPDFFIAKKGWVKTLTCIKNLFENSLVVEGIS